LLPPLWLPPAPLPPLCLPPLPLPPALLPPLLLPPELLLPPAPLLLLEPAHAVKAKARLPASRASRGIAVVGLDPTVSRSMRSDFENMRTSKVVE
jgi:hypothetical protein